jgi:hypothetical protein
VNGTSNTVASAAKSFVFTDTADVVASAAVAQALYYGTASTSGVTRTATFTAYDQYGDPWAGEVVAFSSAGTLIDNPTDGGLGSELWTTVANHGLAVGDDLVVAALNDCDLSPTDGGTAVAADDVLTVEYATTSTTFSLKDAGGSTITSTSTDCNNATDGVSLTSTSFASVSRTTGSAGTASVTWSDSEGTSGVDTITADGASLTAVTSEYYRTLNSTSVANTTAFTTTATNTAADWIVADSTDAALSDVPASGLGAWVEYWDNANDVLVVGVAHGEASTGSQQTHYLEYAYDANDQFAYATVVPATGASIATTLAYFEYYLNIGQNNAVDNWAGTSAANGGPVHVDYEPAAAGISVFNLG